ncbi:MAG: CRISPR-associated endonuclease Cas1 [Elusimicrobia bacterium]|nr:CRISPR-associated endonuclease Cas1 [Elusimicrobiota bacterium]MBR4632105.1 CRISPR-associated endonuclease Cas1 [Elusimicrobiota bacterium]
MNLDYIIRPQKYVQQELFGKEYTEYYSTENLLFFDTFIRWQFNENLLFYVSKDFSCLLVSGFGVKLSKKSERLQIKENNKVMFEIPFFKLNTVAIFSKGVGLSSDLLEEFIKNNINLSFHDYSGKPYALLNPINATNNTILKRKQLNIKDSVEESNLIIKIISGKISNQISLLKYITKNIKANNEQNILKLNATKNAIEQMNNNIEKILTLEKNMADIEETKTKIMGYEGTCARIYWETISVLLKNKIDFFGREHKMPTDIVNTLLNYGYGILYSQIWKAIVLSGLDPYIGLLHTENKGKPSLVFDLIEEFRAPVVDRTVISFIMSNKKIKVEQGFISLETRQKFSNKILDRLETKEQFMGGKYKISDIILLQARNIVNYILQESKNYKSFSFKW